MVLGIGNPYGPTPMVESHIYIGCKGATWEGVFLLKHLEHFNKYCVASVCIPGQKIFLLTD